MIETQDFDDYVRERVSRDGRLPLAGSLELTWRCNLACVHCYMVDYRREPELEAREVRRILDELADAGCLQLLITGGEPLLRRDFRDIWRYAKEKGFVLTLFTNATLVDDETAAFLRDSPPVVCEVSLYGASRETYGRACGVPEAFDAAVAGLDRLRGVLAHVSVKTMAFRENGDDMEALAVLCEERGVEFHFDTDIFPRLDLDPAPFRHAFPPEEGVRRVMASELHQRVWGNQAEKWDGAGAKPLKRASKVVVCRAGESSFLIGPYGDLCLCTLLREPSFSLREGDFMTGWTTTIRDLLERERSTPVPCADCPDLKRCVPCAGRNYLETGTCERAAPVMCRRAHAVSALFGQAREHQEAPSHAHV
ncbi:MAG TPA: radical SAM protein [Sumerlaeia bacterium]|nr:radical SAM protein [Sumerlaeia bacterium]